MHTTYYLRHVSHHPPRHLVAGERRRLPQHGDSPPRDLQGSHNALEQRGLATSAGSQQAVSAEWNWNCPRIGLTRGPSRQSEDKEIIIKMKISAQLQISPAKTPGNVKYICCWSLLFFLFVFYCQDWNFDVTLT